MLNSKALAASASAAKVYVEDVFSTWLYTGNGSTQTITNGIDLSGEGGMVWLKCRTNAFQHGLFDTARGANKFLQSNSSSGQEASFTDILTAFNAGGFTLGADAGTLAFNSSGSPARNYASWTFRKAAKFFDVITWSGDGSSSRAISHNLGSVPGCIIVKSTNVSGSWETYHRSLNGGTNPQACKILLNSTAAQVGPTTGAWANTAPTSTVFYVNGTANTNDSGKDYVAYLFAHDAGGFGDSGNDSVVKCGSMTVSGNAATVSLGWEPQFLLMKASSTTSDWFVVDNMRGFSESASPFLRPNTAGAESANAGTQCTATGFTTSGVLDNGTWIYIAIRRGPMKTPTDATTVFATDTAGGTAPNPPLFNGVLTDLGIYKNVSGSYVWNWGSRLQGEEWLESNSTNAAGADSGYRFDYQDGFYASSNVQSAVRGWLFRRAPGFFDVVAYTGTGSARTVSHNLGVAPELMIVKCRSVAGRSWFVYSNAVGNGSSLTLETSDASSSGTAWNNTTPTSSVFSIGGGASINGSGDTFIAYLFATCPGVSKVGSYTGTGTTLDIDCGFTSGARFVLIKRTDSTGDWYVWDTARGIVSGNDPYLLLNSTAAEVTSTDYIDPLSSGFQISSTAPAAINANGGSFIFLAIA